MPLLSLPRIFAKSPSTAIRLGRSCSLMLKRLVAWPGLSAIGKTTPAETTNSLVLDTVLLTCSRSRAPRACTCPGPWLKSMTRNSRVEERGSGSPAPSPLSAAQRLGATTAKRVKKATATAVESRLTVHSYATHDACQPIVDGMLVQGKAPVSRDSQKSTDPRPTRHFRRF